MTGADYDPLTLPAAYFEGLPTGVPNNLPSQPEPVEDMSAGADLTGKGISERSAAPGKMPVGVEAVTSPAPLDASGSDLTVAGSCTQQHTPAGGTSQ